MKEKSTYCKTACDIADRNTKYENHFNFVHDSRSKQLSMWASDESILSPSAID